MLQFITHADSHLNIQEQVRKVIEGGCCWIQLSVDADRDVLRHEAELVIPICQTDDSFLVLDHDVELTDELKVHGVHLSPGDMLPLETREKLGPHAVIGVSVTTAAEIIALRSADIDYVQVGPYPEFSLERYREIVDEIHQAEVKIPVVATGDIKAEDLKPLMATGISGVAMSRAIITADDPVAYTARCIAILNDR